MSSLRKARSMTKSLSRSMNAPHVMRECTSTHNQGTGISMQYQLLAPAPPHRSTSQTTVSLTAPQWTFRWWTTLNWVDASSLAITVWLVTSRRGARKPIFKDVRTTTGSHEFRAHSTWDKTAWWPWLHIWRREHIFCGLKLDAAFDSIHKCRE